MDLRNLLAAEFERRHRANPRYSLRAFALSLGTHHTTLLRFLRQGKRLLPGTARSIGARLGLTPAQISQAADHQRAEAILARVARGDFRADSRWLAITTGLSLDEVNLALHRLLYDRRLTMRSTRTWTREDA
jgi:hypothetical protein